MATPKITAYVPTDVLNAQKNIKQLTISKRTVTPLLNVRCILAVTLQIMKDARFIGKLKKEEELQLPIVNSGKLIKSRPRTQVEVKQ